MYFQNGQITFLLQSTEALICIRSSADRLLIASCSETCLDLWRTHSSTKLFRYQRSEESIMQYGHNKLLYWRPDGCGIAVVTDTGRIILFEVKLDLAHPLSYQCVDSNSAAYLHESVGTVPSIVLDAVMVVNGEEEITSLNGLNNDLMIFTTVSGSIKQFVWDDGIILEEFESDISQVHFTDPNEHSYSPENDININNLCYSQALDIAAVTFSNGRAGYISSSEFFKPSTIHALLAPSLTDASCASINTRYHLLTFGTEHGEVFVYVLNYDSGLLNLSHQLKAYSESQEGARTADSSKVIKVFWTPDCCCLCAVYSSGSMYMWSVYGTFLYSSSTPVARGCWDLEGYNLWVIHGVKLSKIPFLKSPLTVNNVSNNQQHIILQSANQVFILPNRFSPKSGLSVYESIYRGETENYDSPHQSFLASLGSPLENWPWQAIKVPEIYANGNCPLRFVAIGASGQCTAVAGSRGFAFYISAKHKWRCFGNEAQEQSMIVRGGMLWWRGILIVGAFHPDNKSSKIYMYPHHNSIDKTSVVCTIPLPSSIITLNTYEDYLIVVTGNSRVIVYQLTLDIPPTLEVSASYHKVLEFSVAKYTPHPCAVLSAHVSPLTSDAGVPDGSLKSILINIAGKLLMFEIGESGEMNNKPVTIATNVESVSCPTKTSNYLGAALWLNCGIRGMRVWLPLHGTKQDLGSRRILITVKQNVYPLVVHHYEAAILGIPADSLKCRSETFLHILLHQLVVINLEKHAYAIAKMCEDLPYFQHTLELMIHKALESDMCNDRELLGDAVLPHVIRFMRQLPHYLSAVAHCARKTEMMQWQYLFQCTGAATDLLDECLAQHSLDTAVLYLVILQNLQPLPVSRNYIVKLLEASIQQNRWDLGVDLLRFLHVISNESENPPIRQKKLTGQTHDLIIRLRRSSGSFDDEIAPLSPSTPGIEAFSYDMLANDNDVASDKKRAQRIITHHAHRLLKSCQFHRLGEMCYHLNFELLQFLQKEKQNLCDIDDPVHVFMSIHEEFHWPYPDIIPRILSHPKVSSNMNVISIGSEEAKEMTAEASEFDEKVDFISDSVSLYEGSVYSECRVEIDPTILAQALKRGTPESTTKLEHFLNVLVDAGVYNYALLFALVLRNVELITTIIQRDPSSEMLSILMAVDCWGHQESGGYSLFLQSLKPLITPLFPTSANDLRLRPLVKICSSSMSSLNSSNSNSQDIHYVTNKKEVQQQKAINENSESRYNLEGNMNHLSIKDGDQSTCSVS